MEQNIPKTLDNMREFNPTMITADPSSSKTAGTEPNQGPDPESLLDISRDPFASDLQPAEDVDPFVPPKVLLTTSPRATKASYEFCEELLSVIPGAEFVRRPKSMNHVEVGRIAGWAAGRGYNSVIVVNEDRKVCSAFSAFHFLDWNYVLIVLCRCYYDDTSSVWTVRVFQADVHCAVFED